MVGMVKFNVGDDDVGWREFQKRTVRFIRFCHEPLTCANFAIAAEVDHFRTDEHGWVVTQLRQDVTDHRSGRALTVSAGNSDAALAFHQKSKGIGSVQDGQTSFLGFKKFGIVTRDCAADYHRFSITYVSWLVSDEHLTTRLADSFCVG